MSFLARKSSLYAAFAFLIALMAAMIGCSSANFSAPKPAFSGSTNVTVLIRSTANDQLSQFEINFNSLSMVTKSGKTSNLLTTGQSAEFIHVNGQLEPLLTVSVPQGLYTSATVTIQNAFITCVAQQPQSQGLLTAEFGGSGTPQVTVGIPAPITITGSAMVLVLELNVSESAMLSDCSSSATSSINPVFDLAAAKPSQQAAGGVAELGLNGEVTAVNLATNSFTVALPGGPITHPNSTNGPSFSVGSNSSTVFHGVSGISSLPVGSFVNLDASIQADGSQLATRVEVEDTDPANLTVSTGPLMQIASSQPSLFAFGRQNQGFLWNSDRAGNFMPYSHGNAVFQISRQFTNLQSLPFVPVFDAAHIFDGQNVYVTTHAITLSPGPTYFPAATITLIPQTIDGTVTSISSAGGFTTYTVTLAPYDLIPNLAVQPGQTTVLTNPNTAIVYVDSNTQLLNSAAVALGDTLRFTGLVFDDNGTLRVDCSQVNDGVPQ